MATKSQKQMIREIGSQKVEENVNTPVAGDDIKQYANSLLADYERLEASVKEHQAGLSLPYREIMEAADLMFDTVQKEALNLEIMVKVVPKLLAEKYRLMGDNTNIVVVKEGHSMREYKNNELREKRERQLAHMMDPKTKDNMYRRLYGLGYRKEYKRFELREKDLVRVAKPSHE